MCWNCSALSMKASQTHEGEIRHILICIYQSPLITTQIIVVFKSFVSEELKSQPAFTETMRVSHTMNCFLLIKLTEYKWVIQHGLGYDLSLAGSIIHTYWLSHVNSLLINSLLVCFCFLFILLQHMLPAVASSDLALVWWVQVHSSGGLSWRLAEARADVKHSVLSEWTDLTVVV